MPCFCCGKDIGTEPDRSVTFFATGNFGSLIWDPMGADHKLALWIHDVCLMERVDLVGGVVIRATSYHDEYRTARELIEPEPITITEKP
jgi:hypothetical protein